MSSKFWQVRSSLISAMGLALALMAAMMPQSTNAQDSGASDFCSSGGSELISAIGGNWTFKQGPGAGVGAIIPFPLPAHPPQSVLIEVDEKAGVARSNMPARRWCCSSLRLKV